MRTNEIKSIFPELTHPGLLAAIEKHAVFLTFQKGEVLLGQGDDIAAIPLLLSGTIKVIREDITDREIMVYTIQPGESCVLSLSSMLTSNKSKITAMVEEPSEAMILPGNLVRRWMREYEEWMNYVFHLFDKRLSDVLSLVDGLSFRSIEQRLWQHLQAKANVGPGREVRLTHQELALELGTVREVVSRILKNMEREGRIKLSRGRIELLGVEAAVPPS